MVFLRKHLLGVAIILLAVTCIGLYLFLVRPVMLKRRKVVRATVEAIAQLRRYKKELPSPRVITELKRDKERLESQYEEVVKNLNFAQRVPLPKNIGKLNLYFEEQIENVQKELKVLEERTGIKIPDRLGFEQERPQSREELSALVSQLDSARKLASLVVEAGVSDLSVLRPLPLAKDRFVKVSGNLSLEDLKFELEVRARAPSLTKLLYRLANYSSFFIVENLEIKTVTGKEKRSSRPDEVQRRRRRSVSPEDLPGEKVAEEKEKTADEGGETELQAKLFIATQLLLSNSE